VRVPVSPELILTFAHQTTIQEILDSLTRATAFITDVNRLVAVGSDNTFCFNIHGFGDLELQASG
jgi:hypothetical protein